MRLFRSRPALFGAAAVAAATMFLGGYDAGSTARAALVAPGGSVTTDPATDTINPTGELVDEDVRTITFQYVADAGFGFSDPDQASVDVTFRSRVYRDPLTQVLSFLYQWEGTPNSFGREGAGTTVSAFADFTTDVTAQLGGLEGTINRSADGSEIQAFTPGSGLGDIPSLLVVTSATEFDQNGTLRSFVGDEFNLFEIASPEDKTVDTVGADVFLSGIFQPILDDGGNGGGGGGGGGTPIPLPAGVWGGLALLGGTGIGGSLRRRLARRA